MLYKKAIKTESQTWKTSPDETLLTLSPGVVEQVMVEFPAGCVGLVGIRISLGLFQLWPLTADQWLVANNVTLTFPADHVLRSRETRLRIETYNEDTQHDHTVTVSFVVKIPDVVSEELLTVLMERVPLGLEDMLSSVEVIESKTGVVVTIMQDEMIPYFKRIIELEEEKAKRVYRNMSTEELSRV